MTLTSNVPGTTRHCVAVPGKDATMTDWARPAGDSNLVAEDRATAWAFPLAFLVVYRSRDCRRGPQARTLGG